MSTGTGFSGIQGFDLLPSPLPVANGGTGATSASDARTNLSVNKTTLLVYNEIGAFWAAKDIADTLTDESCNIADNADIPNTWVAKRAGSITGVSAALSAAITTGTITVKVFKNGVASGLSSAITATNAKGYATAAIGTYTFVAGDLIDIRITTTADLDPLTLDLTATVEVAI